MELDVNREIAVMSKMTTDQLRNKHLELFGEPSRSSNRAWLFRRLAWRLQSLTQGSLSDRARQRAGDLARESDIRVIPPKQVANLESHPDVKAKFTVKPDDRLPMPNMLITRPYKGKMYEVKVLPKGFEFEGERYRSLSAIAYKITGSHWNGYQFFNLHKDKSE